MWVGVSCSVLLFDLPAPVLCSSFFILLLFFFFFGACKLFVKMSVRVISRLWFFKLCYGFFFHEIPI